MDIKRTSTLSSTTLTSQPLPTVVWITEKRKKLADFYPKSPLLVRAIPCPAESVQAIESGGETQKKMMVTWVKEKMHGAFTKTESQMGADYEQGRLEMLVEVALQCLEEDRDARPTMSQVVEMLLHHENN